MVFVLRDCDKCPPIVRLVVQHMQWDVIESDAFQEEVDHYNWNLWWKSARFTFSQVVKCAPFQRMNHLPRSWEITKKDALARHCRKYQSIFGEAFRFAPETYMLPNEYLKFVKAYAADDDKVAEGKLAEKPVWIAKPADMSRGRKIFMFNDLADLAYDDQYVIQRYIERPLTIGGYKLDLRLYVLVPSVHPLEVFLFTDGLVRFGTEKYDGAKLGNLFAHLTNASINKLAPNYNTVKDGIGAGCKWTLQQLFDHFKATGVDILSLWTKITRILLNTVLLLVNFVPYMGNNSCFELFGFDVIIDENMKPWLLEANFSAALGLDSPSDFHVKVPLIEETIKSINVQDIDKESWRAEKESVTRKPRVSTSHGRRSHSADGDASEMKQTMVRIRRLMQKKPSQGSLSARQHSRFRSRSLSSRPPVARASSARGVPSEAGSSCSPAASSRSGDETGAKVQPAQGEPKDAEEAAPSPTANYINEAEDDFNYSNDDLDKTFSQYWDRRERYRRGKFVKIFPFDKDSTDAAELLSLIQKATSSAALVSPSTRSFSDVYCHQHLKGGDRNASNSFAMQYTPDDFLKSVVPLCREFAFGSLFKDAFEL